MAYSTTISIAVIPDSLYKISGPTGVDAYYSGKKVLGSGANNYFIANGTTALLLESAEAISDSISIVKIQISYYETYDSQGGIWAFQPSVDKWVSRYSYRPEWISLVGNRLVTFKGGMPYIHNSSTYNTFYGQLYDSTVSFVHNEEGNVTKTYNAFYTEGSTPDLVHIRTEVPSVQSSDIRASAYDSRTMLAGDFKVKEGVNYATILRDRLSANVYGTYDQKLSTGEVVRGEVAKFQVVFFTPSGKKLTKFASIGFTPSRGHNK